MDPVDPAGFGVEVGDRQSDRKKTFLRGHYSAWWCCFMVLLGMQYGFHLLWGTYVGPLNWFHWRHWPITPALLPAPLASAFDSHPYVLDFNLEREPIYSSQKPTWVGAPWKQPSCSFFPFPSWYTKGTPFSSAFSGLDASHHSKNRLQPPSFACDLL